MAESSSSTNRVRSIYLQAKRLSFGAEREGYLDDACGSDTELRREVESLLEADQAAEDFLSNNAVGAEIESRVERPGMVLGHYRLQEIMGEGGFGVVWRAEQLQPMKREVALKILKPGMDTKEVIARFEAERQALAMLAHPNIARVYDAGTTDKGRPYFVMDLIEGASITDYCDHRNLPVAQRLDLFLQVCEAAQHAHVRGIVHRDLKPSNVVVIGEEGKPRIKVIDFGIAKSMQGRLTDKTLFTRREVLLGTPVYMSPEQLNLDADTVDARSDVYSLGVLLYELIAGTPPYESETLREAAFSEVQRILREVEPPKPSTRFGRLGSQATQISECRAMERPALQRLLRGDLDWVVMRALEKDPGRRYATAADLAQDLQRHLRHEPVLAGPPSVAYRARKFAQRHRVTLAWSTATAVLLIIGGLLSLRLAEERARQAEARARPGSSQTGYRTADGFAQQLIQDIVSVEEGAQLSPDETMLAYVRWDGPDADIWVRDLQTGEQRNLTQSEKHKPGVYEMCLEAFVWSPDSRRLVYSWADDRGVMSLRVLVVDNLLPAVSFSGTNQTYSVAMDMNSSRPRVLFAQSSKTSYDPEAWTHDGRQVLCRRTRPEGMVLVSCEAGTIRTLPILENLKHPRFSPDDRYLVFSRSNHIHLLDIETSQLTQLTFEGNNSTPIWSPDGSAVLFSSDRLGNWDLWGVRIEDDRPQVPVKPVRYGVGNHDKRLTQFGSLVVHRKLAPTDGYTIAHGAPVEPLPPSNLPGLIYFGKNGKVHSMTPDGAEKKMLPANIGGEPSYTLHGGHRWFLQTREMPGEPYPSGDSRKGLFAVRDDGDETATVQLTADAAREPLQARWARDRESDVVDGLISWSVRFWDQNTNEPPTAIFAARIAFDAAGNVTELEGTQQAPLVIQIDFLHDVPEALGGYELVMLCEAALLTPAAAHFKQLQGYVSEGGHVVLAANGVFGGTPETATKVLRPYGLLMEHKFPGAALTNVTVVADALTKGVHRVRFCSPSRVLELRNLL